MRVDGKNNTNTSTVKVHNVVILDGSSSMGGLKYENAKEGVQLDLETCKKEDISTYSFIEFGSTSHTLCFLKPINDVELSFLDTGGLTSLYQTLGETLDKLCELVPSKDKVLVKIFTDGEENASSGKYANKSVLSKKIKKCEKLGYTITFIGTEYDTNTVVNNLNIDKSNTLVHDNTGEGIKTAFNVQSKATSNYSKRMKEGEDVTRGFYSKTVIDNN